MSDRRQFLHDSARLSAFALAGSALWRISPALAQTGSEGKLATMTLSELAHRLSTREVTSRQLVEEALAAIRDSRGEGSRVFLMVHEGEALAAADRADIQRKSGTNVGVLSGIPISIKDCNARRLESSGRSTAGPAGFNSRPTIEKSRRDHHRPYQSHRVRVLGAWHQPALRHAEKHL